MSIPGQNILNMALSVIAAQSFVYRAYTGRKLQPNGLYVASYTESPTRGSVQPVPRSMYAIMGLDLQKDYFNFFLSKNIIDVGRDVSGDQFTFNGRSFQCISKTDWNAMDGWDQVLCASIPAAGGGAC